MGSDNDQFDWDDYHGDTRSLSLEARGAWWDCLYQMRKSPTRGRLCLPLSGFATMFGTTLQKAKKVLEEIGEHGVGNLECNAVTNRNGKITVINRRMYRAYLDAESNKNRQAAYRGRKKAEKNNGNVTNTLKPPSEEDVLNQEEGKQQKQKRRNLVASSRIPDPFPITEHMRSWLQSDLPRLRKVEEAHDRFVEYYTNLTTAKAFKVDWVLTWKKGMKLALKWQDEADEKKAENRDRGQIGKYDPSEPDPTVDCSTCHDTKQVTYFPKPNSVEGMEILDCPACVPTQEKAAA